MQILGLTTALMALADKLSTLSLVYGLLTINLFVDLGGDETMSSLPNTANNSISNAWREGSALQRNAGTIGRCNFAQNF
jgi:hypothetical protein